MVLRSFDLLDAEQSSGHASVLGPKMTINRETKLNLSSILP